MRLDRLKRTFVFTLLPFAGLAAAMAIRGGAPAFANPPSSTKAAAEPSPVHTTKSSPAALSTPKPKATGKDAKDGKDAKEKFDPSKLDAKEKAAYDKMTPNQKAAYAKAWTPPAPPPEEEKKPQGVQHVLVGVYLKELPDIDVKTNTYTADFYIWFRWKGEIDPTKTWEFVNVIEPNNTSKVPVFPDGPDEIKEGPHAGEMYQTFHVQGKFSHPFNLKDFPFDEQDIVIELEDAQYDVQKLVYDVDTEGTTYEPHISVPGWKLAQAKPSLSESVYLTNFGDPRVKGGEDKYSRFTFGVHLGRPIAGYMAKTILPIAIVIMITFVAFLIHSGHFEARVGLIITSLISAVALQLTAVSELPSVGYLVLLDKVYNVSYAVILWTLLESVISVKLLDREKERAAVWLDRIALGVSLVGFFGSIGLLIALR